KKTENVTPIETLATKVANANTANLVSQNMAEDSSLVNKYATPAVPETRGTKRKASADLSCGKPIKKIGEIVTTSIRPVYNATPDIQQDDIFLNPSTKRKASVQLGNLSKKVDPNKYDDDDIFPPSPPISPLTQYTQRTQGKKRDFDEAFGDLPSGSRLRKQRKVDDEVSVKDILPRDKKRKRELTDVGNPNYKRVDSKRADDHISLKRKREDNDERMQDRKRVHLDKMFGTNIVVTKPNEKKRKAEEQLQRMQAPKRAVTSKIFGSDVRESSIFGQDAPEMTTDLQGVAPGKTVERKKRGTAKSNQIPVRVSTRSTKGKAPIRYGA
ncbi:hypothetical protein HKX48_000687, partial [Thoreauomyces humboldtii]